MVMMSNDAKISSLKLQLADIRYAILQTEYWLTQDPKDRLLRTQLTKLKKMIKPRVTAIEYLYRNKYTSITWKDLQIKFKFKYYFAIDTSK